MFQLTYQKKLLLTGARVVWLWWLVPGFLKDVNIVLLKALLFHLP